MCVRNVEDLGEVIDDVARLIHCLAINEQTWDLTLTANLNKARAASSATISCIGSSMLFCSIKDMTLWQYGQVGL